MADDIVTRLRNWHDQRDSWQTLTEAADEIERLREIIDNLIRYGECNGTDACDDCLWDLWVERYRDGGR